MAACWSLNKNASVVDYCPSPLGEGEGEGEGEAEGEAEGEGEGEGEEGEGQGWEKSMRARGKNGLELLGN